MSPARARFWIAKAEAAWPLASASAATPPFERGDALLEHVGGRVHDPGVDVAELLEREQVGGVLGALELIGGGLVDRHRDGAGRRIGAPTGVKRESFRLHETSISPWGWRSRRQSSKSDAMTRALYYDILSFLCSIYMNRWNEPTIAVRPRVRKATAARRTGGEPALSASAPAEAACAKFTLTPIVSAR